MDPLAEFGIAAFVAETSVEPSGDGVPALAEKGGDVAGLKPVP